MSPMAPMGGPASIVTEKDDQGNTVIHLMREGQPTEITVKDGEVWIDGRKVEEGESLVLPGESPVAIWNNSEGQGYSFGASPNALFRTEWNPEEMARLQKEQAEEMAQQQKAMAKDFKRQEKEWKKQQKQMTKKQQEEMERQRQEMQRAQGEMQRAQAEMVRSQIEMQQNQGNMERARAEANRSNNFGTTMKNELKRDGLLPDPNHYSVQLNNQELIVNGKKQSDDLHRKYLDIYRQKTGQELGTSGNVNIVENRD